MSKEKDLAQRVHQLENELETVTEEGIRQKIELNKELQTARKQIVGLIKTAETQSTEIDNLQDTNARLQEFVDEVTTPPQDYGEIVRVYEDENAVDVEQGGTIQMRKVRPGVGLSSLSVGDRIRIDAKTQAVVGIAPFDDRLGDERRLISLYDNGTARIEDKMGHRRIARMTSTVQKQKPEGGERVIVSGNFITGIIGANNKEALASLSDVTMAQLPDMTFDDIAGHDAIIERVLEDILSPYDDPRGNEDYKIESGFKYLFFGPPGNGKTSLIKAIARLIYDRFETQIVAAGVKGNLIAIHGPELASKWVGETEEKMRAIFEGGAKLHELIKCPVIISIDDCEAFLLQRGTSNASTVNMDYVTQMTSLMEGVREYPGVSLVLTTNRIDLMDGAIIGRMHLTQYIPPPDTPEKVDAIIRKHLRGIPLQGEDPVATIVDRLFEDSPEMDAIEVQFEEDESERMPLREFISGRMIREIVREAKKSARRRDRTLPAEQRPSGISEDDLREALESHLENSGSLPSTRATVAEFYRQRGDKRTILYVNVLRDKKKQESRKRREDRIDQTVV